MPISSNWARASVEGKWVVVVTRDPSDVDSNQKLIDVDGMSVLGVPSGRAKPSRTSNDAPSPSGSLTSAHSQYPPCVDPSGPVMT